MRRTWDSASANCDLDASSPDANPSRACRQILSIDAQKQLACENQIPLLDGDGDDRAHQARRKVGGKPWSGGTGGFQHRFHQAVPHHVWNSLDPAAHRLGGSLVSRNRTGPSMRRPPGAPSFRSSSSSSLESFLQFPRASGTSSSGSRPCRSAILASAETTSCLDATISRRMRVSSEPASIRSAIVDKPSS